MPLVSSTAPSGRADALVARRREIMDRLYRDHRYRVAEKVALTGTDRFQTPLGHTGRNGFILVNLDPAIAGDQQRYGDLAMHIVGATLLRSIVAEYGAVDGVPAPRPPGRPRGTKSAPAVSPAAVLTGRILADVAGKL